MTKKGLVMTLATSAIVILMACGGSPSAPSPIVTTPVITAPTKILVTVTFKDAFSGSQLNTIKVTTSARPEPQIVNSGGSIEFMSNDYAMSVEKDGYRGPWLTAYNLTHVEFMMIPSPKVATEDDLKQILHGDTSGYDNPGLQATRAAKIPFHFYLVGKATDGRDLQDVYGATLATNVAKFEKASRLYYVPGQQAIECPISINSQLPVQGRATLGVSVGNVTSCGIAYSSEEGMIFGSSFLHEMGHAAGLFHWMGVGMVGYKYSLGNINYSEAELEAIRILQAQAPGTGWVRNDRATYMTSSVNALNSGVRGFTGVVVIDD
jgi:hypothetical protein